MPFDCKRWFVDNAPRWTESIESASNVFSYDKPRDSVGRDGAESADASESRARDCEERLLAEFNHCMVEVLPGGNKAVEDCVVAALKRFNQCCAGLRCRPARVVLHSDPGVDI